MFTVKKTYLAPECESENLEMESDILTASGSGDDWGDGGDD